MKWVTLSLTAALGVLIMMLIRPENDLVPLGTALALLLIYDTVWLFIGRKDRAHKE